MSKYIFEFVRQRDVAAELHGFATQLKANGQALCSKGLMFYFKPLRRTVYFRYKKVVNPSQKSKLNIATKGLLSINLSRSI